MEQQEPLDLRMKPTDTGRRNGGKSLKACPAAGCKYASKRSSDTKRHFNVKHLKIKDKKCKVEGCPTATATSSDLRKHVRSVHEKEKNYTCASCPRAFFSKKDGMKHANTHHGVDGPKLVCRKGEADMRALYEREEYESNHPEHFRFETEEDETWQSGGGKQRTFHLFDKMTKPFKISPIRPEPMTPAATLSEQVKKLYVSPPNPEDLNKKSPAIELPTEPLPYHMIKAEVEAFKCQGRTFPGSGQRPSLPAVTLGKATTVAIKVARKTAEDEKGSKEEQLKVAPPMQKATDKAPTVPQGVRGEPVKRGSKPSGKQVKTMSGSPARIALPKTPVPYDEIEQQVEADKEKVRGFVAKKWPAVPAMDIPKAEVEKREENGQGKEETETKNPTEWDATMANCGMSADCRQVSEM